MEGVKSIVWRDDGSLRIEASVVQNCAARIPTGGYSISGGTIYLTYESRTGTMRAACNCAHRLAYEISGIPKATYEVHLPKTGMSVP